MTRITRAYGMGTPLQDVFPEPIIAQRLPRTLDHYDNGQVWIYQPGRDIFVATDTTAGVTNWEPISSSAGASAITKFVVDADGTADYTTVQAAITTAAALGGAVIYVRPGVYIENLTLYDGIMIQGAGLETTITGVHTPPAAGQITFYDVTLASATDIVTSAVAGTTDMLFFNCAINCTNGYIVDCANWTGTIDMIQCAELSTINGIINNQSTTVLNMWNCVLGAGATNIAKTGGSIIMYNSRVIVPITTAGATTVMALMGSSFGGMLTLGGTSTGSISNSTFSTGVNAAITQSSAGILVITNTTITSTADPAIAGAGAGVMMLSGVSFMSNTSIAGTLTLVHSDILKMGGLTLGGTDMLQATIVVSNAELQALAAAPKELVAAPGAGYYLDFLGGTISLLFDTAAIDDAVADGDLLIRTGTTNTAQSLTVEADGLVDAAATAASTVKSLATDVILDANESLELFNTGAEYTVVGGGSGTLSVTVLYRILNLN